MNEMQLGLPFFAKLIQADVQDLNYAIVKRKYNDGHVTMNPCLTVYGINNYVFDLVEGRFAALGKRADSIVKKEKAFVVKNEQGIILRTKQGHTLTYTEREFKKLYCFRIVNPVLYR